MIQTQNKYARNLCITPIKLVRRELSESEESEGYNDLMKSHMSSPSTVDSPLFSPKKGFSSDSDIEEDSACHSFNEDGYCCRGACCEETHITEGSVTSNSSIMNNYP